MSIRYLDFSGAVNFWTNIKNYILSKIPTKTSELTNDSGFLTQHQSLSNYVTLNSEQTITGKKLFTNATTKVNSVNTFTGSTQFIDLSTTVPRGSFPESAYRVGRVYIGDNTSYNGSWFIIDPTIDTDKAYYRMVTTSPDNTDSTRFSITWDSTKEGARRRRLACMGDLICATNNTYQIGESGNVWKDAYINKIHGISDYTNFLVKVLNYTTTLTHAVSGRRTVVCEGDITLTLPMPEEGSWFHIKATTGSVLLNFANGVSVSGVDGIPITLKPGESILLCYYTASSYVVLTSHPSITLSTNTTSTASPAHGGTFTCIDSVTQDANGHITKVNTKTVTLPSDNNTDTKVKQYEGTTNQERPILSRYNSTEASQTANFVVYDTGVTSNPAKHTITASGGFIGKLSGVPTGNTYVSAVKDGGALVNSQATAWGAIWRAPTKDYQVAGATWSSTNNNVYICYSVTNANAEAGTNTMAKSLIWAADTGTLTTTTFSGALSGNASTATQFSANKDVTLTGDVTGTASSKAGWTVSTTLSNSGVTAGTYGPSADVTGNNNTTISVPQITVDAKGRVTSVTNRTYTSVNTDTNTDTKVTQTVTNDNACYPLLIANTASASHTGLEPTTETDEVRKAYNINVQARYGFIYARNSYTADNLKGSVAGGNRTSAGFYGSTYDGAIVGGVELGHVDKYGNRYSRLYATNYITDGALAPDGTAVAATFDVGVLADGTKYLNTSAGWYCNVYPTVDNTRTLGTSSLRWKECYSNAYYLGTTAFGDIVTHNASEFLTSHQSLSSCVKNVVTNNQTIKSTGITRGTAPSSAQTFGIAFSDNNNKYIGNIYGQYATDKSTCVGLYAYKGTTTSNGDNAYVRVGYDASGNVYTSAPTPATTDNSTQIATTAFVKAQGYLTSHQSLANYVTTNTDQSISGIKSHSKHISILGDYLGNEFSTNARTCLYLKSNRDTDGQSGIYFSKYRQNVAQGALTGSNLVSLSLDVLENSVRTNGCIFIQFRYFENDVPTNIYFIPKASATSYMGTADNPWTNAYITNLNINGHVFDPISTSGNIGDIVFAYADAAGVDLSTKTTSGNNLDLIYIDRGESIISGSSSGLTGTWKFLGSTPGYVSTSGIQIGGVWKRIA